MKHDEERSNLEFELNASQRLGHLGSWAWDAVRNEIWWSDEYFRIIGQDPLEPTPNYEEHLKAYTPESAARLDAMVKRALETGEPYELELEYAKPTPTVQWLHAVGEVTRDGSGNIIGLRGIAQNITQRRRAEKERDQFYKFFITSSDLMCIADPNGAFLKTNPSFTETLGYSEAELVSKPFVDFIVPEDKQATIDEMSRQLLQGYSLNFENRYFCRDGSVKWLSWRAVYEKNEGITYATARDITEWKLAEEALREGEERFNTAFHFMPVALGITTVQERHFLAVNKAFEAIYGYGAEELKGRTAGEVNIWANAEDREQVMASLKLGQAVRNFETTIRRKDGGLRRVFYSGALVRLNGQDCLLSAAVDITERKQAEVALEASQRELNQFFSLVPDLVAIASTDGYFKKLNPAWEHTLGFTLAELLAQPFESFVHPDDVEPTRQAVLRQIAGHEVVHFINRYRTRAGTYRLLEWMTSPAIDGSILFAVARDITDRARLEEERRALEQQVARSQKMESLGSLAGGVAHDMNNVLAAILFLAGIHQMQEPEGTPLRSNMDTIAKACLRGRTLLQGLLSFARQTLTEVQALDLNVLVREEAALLERTTLQKVRLEIDLDSRLRPIKGESSALSQALMNLCVNAVYAMPEGGTLTLRTRNVGESQVLLEVTDSGIGMPKEVLDKALDPFFTTKPHGEGTGLGLAIVFGTVKAHKGQMDLRSTPGKGTTVSIVLPACEDAALAVSGDEKNIPQKSRSLSVLVVDDDQLIQQSCGQLLEALGHSSTIVGSGEEALSWLGEGAACDMVVLDMNMPGMGGAATLPRIRALRPDLPVLLATGRANQEAIDLVESIPKTTLLAKPFSLADLRRHLQDLA